MPSQHTLAVCAAVAKLCLYFQMSMRNSLPLPQRALHFFCRSANAAVGSSWFSMCCEISSCTFFFFSIFQMSSPTNSSTNVAPRDQTSVLKLLLTPPKSDSGAICRNVPGTTLICVTFADSFILLNPKSHTFTWEKSLETSTFGGFMSPWTTLFSCRCTTPETIFSPMQWKVLVSSSAWFYKI